MSRWLLAIILLLSLHNPDSIAADSNASQPIESSARTLWDQGRSAYFASHYQEALVHLKELIDFYPAQEGYLQAHLLLGQSYLKLKNPAAAIEPLKYYINATSQSPKSILARIALAQAYLNLRKFSEAELISYEIQQMEAKYTLKSDEKIEALLIQARAFIGFHQENKAAERIQDIKKQLTETNSSSIQGQTFALELKLKALKCSQLPSQRTLEEGQVIDQMNRRGTCLLEALLPLQKVLTIGELESIQFSVDEIEKAFESYFQTCAYPPLPPLTPKRTEKQLTRYRQELSDHLMKNCKKVPQEALELILAWKSELPSTSLIGLNLAYGSIQKMNTRTK